MDTREQGDNDTSPARDVTRALSDREQIIREYINIPRRHHALNSEPEKFNRLCSALDVIGDTELAVQSYLRDEWPAGPGPAYIQVYGILQMLVVQQDAVRTVSRNLAVAYPASNSDLKRIRDLRNASVGHPANLHDKKFAGFISRGTLQRDGFDLGLISSRGLSSSRFEWVAIPDLIKTQYVILTHVLDDVRNRLREDEMKHRAQFVDTKIEDIFPSSLDYCFQKVYEAIISDERFPLGRTHIEMIRDVGNRFRQALIDRSEWGHSRSLQEEFSSWIEYPLDELAKYFSDKATAYLNDRSAYVFVEFLEHRFKILRKIANEIDATYASAPP